jgi:hypothetical protein
MLLKSKTAALTAKKASLPDIVYSAHGPTRILLTLEIGVSIKPVGIGGDRNTNNHRGDGRRSEYERL